MIRRWIRARQARRACFHHNHRTGESWVTGELIDLGRRKLFSCNHCDQMWFV